MTADMNLTRLYEELSMNAHPALRTQLYDGWILRFSNGYTNRANSANLLYASSLPPDEKIEHCEYMYGSHCLPAVFKLTRALSGELDGPLENRGYRKVTQTDLMTAGIPGNRYSCPDFLVQNHMTEDWTSDYFSLNGLTDQRKIYTARLMFQNNQNKTLYGSIKKAGRTIACGLCVVERGYAGLFDIVVDGAYRRQGFGTDICMSLLTEAARNGARNAYLQVVQTNTNAILLYRKLGFSALYEYWYRVKDMPDPITEGAGEKLEK